jgi:DNA-directed RNA polymerase specialized sigma24 family protein
MTRDELLSNLASDNTLDRLISKMSGNDRYLAEEGKQELFIVLCQLPEEKLLELYAGENNRLNRWICGVLKKFFQRPNDNVYRKVVKWRKQLQPLKDEEAEDEDEDDEITVGKISRKPLVFDEPIGYTPEELEAAIKKLREPDRLMIELYLAEGTYVKVARKLNLNKVLVKRIVNRIKRDLRTILEPELIC